MSHFFRNGIITIFILLSIIEISSIFSNKLGQFGTVIWVLAFLLILIEAGNNLVKITKQTFSRKIPFLLIVLVFFSVTVLLQTSNILNSNSETTQEISCALNNFSTIDFGFRRTCLFGYPDREFFFPALPSLLLGRDVFLLNIGGAIYFISGLIIFAYGLLRFFKKSVYNNFISAILVSSIFHFYYINWFLFGYEQSIFPLSFALITTGLLLSLSHDNFYKNIGLIGISIAYLIFSYTTGLFFAFFAVGILIYLFFSFAKIKEEKIFIISVIFSSVLFLFSSLLVRTDIHLWENYSSSVNLISDITSGLINLAIRGLHTNTNYVSMVFQPLFLVSLVASFLLNKRLYYLPVFAWIVSVFILSIASKGYSYYSVDFRLHRSIVVVPILLVSLGLVIESVKIPFVKKSLLYFVILIIVFITAVIYQNGIISSKANGERHRHVSFILWLRNQLSKDDLLNGGELIFDPALRNINNYTNNYTSIQDSLKYYMPKFSYCLNTGCTSQIGSKKYYIKTYDQDNIENSEIILGVFDFNGDKVQVIKESI